MTTETLTKPAPGAATKAPEDLRALALRHGLSVSGARPGLPAYVRQLWSRRAFIATFATARLTAQYSNAKLGQLWQLMTPLLNAAVYYLIFGVLMNVQEGIPDYVPFLITGVFVWTFTSQSIMTGTRAISGNLGLVRALHFPRASLPLALALQQLQQLMLSLAALAGILFCFGEFPRPSWLLAVPALLLQALFNAGVALVVARLAARTPDIAQLMPFLLRTWMYASGVMWSLQHLAESGRLPDTGPPGQPGERLHRPHALRPDRELHRRPAAAPRLGARRRLGAGGLRGRVHLLLEGRGDVRPWLNRAP